MIYQYSSDFYIEVLMYSKSRVSHSACCIPVFAVGHELCLMLWLLLTSTGHIVLLAVLELVSVSKYPGL